MIRKLKTLPVALVAMLAVSAFTAQAASAHPYHAPELNSTATIFFTVEQHTNTGHQVFTTPSGSVTCKKLHGVGTATNPSSTLTFEPIYTECTAYGFATAHITNHKCHYTFGTAKEIAGEHPTKHTIDPPVVGGANCKGITITPTSFGVSVCTQTVGAQTPTGGHLIAHNIGAGAERSVTVETTITGIHYTGTGGPCGDGTTHTDGKYEGNSYVTCFSDEARTKRTACTIS